MSAWDYDKISRYVDGEMDATEKKAFEELLLQDTGLQKEVALFTEVNKKLKAYLHPDEEEQALRNTLEELRQEYFKNSGAKLRRLSKVRRLAAAMAAAIVIIALVIWSPWSQRDLYRQYASLEMPPVETRGITEDSLQRLVVTSFNDKKFEATLPLFEQLLQLDSSSAYLHFYYALALMETNRYTQSRNELLQLYNGNSLFRYEAAFYMALGYLKEKNYTACREWLNKIPADAGIYSKAQSLLKELPGK